MNFSVAWRGASFGSLSPRTRGALTLGPSPCARPSKGTAPRSLKLWLGLLGYCVEV